MADFPTSVKTFTDLVDGSTDMEATNVNVAYDEVEALQTFLGASGAAQAHNIDVMTYLSYTKAPQLTYNATNSFDVQAGTIAIKKSDGSIKKLRRNTSVTNVTASNLDTGAMAVGYYYVYAVADAAATTFTVKFSASSTTPSGVTNYELIGWFYNETAGVLDITTKQFGNVKTNGRDVPNSVIVQGTDDITTTSTSYVDMTNMSVRFYTSGRPVRILYTAPHYKNGQHPAAQITVDGSSKGIDTFIVTDTQVGKMTLLHEEYLSAGTHTITVQWKATSASTIYQRGATDGRRVLTVTEL